MKKMYLVFVAFLVASLLKANNIQLTNISTVVNNSILSIEFDISWENSWRTPITGNYDGAWVFFKFKDADGKWKPIRFTGNNIVIANGFTMTVLNNPGANGVGAFIYRTNNGSGTATMSNVRSGIEPLPGSYDVKGFAMEMVYIPQGNFYVGDGYTGFSFNFKDGPGFNPFLINSTPIVMGSQAGQLNPQSAPQFGNIGPDCPTGYNAFWIMKYELSVGAYRDFLNTLTYTQQVSRLRVAPTSVIGTSVINAQGRTSLEIATPGVASTTPAVIGCDGDNDNVYNESGDGEWLAMTGAYWPDAAAYLDWAGLRPMTELEFEKACRGGNTPIISEYAWGSTNIATSTYTVSNALQINESITNAIALGNASFNTTAGSFGNFRGGIFATAISTRESSGAGYYGTMELSGNADELSVCVGWQSGKDFTGKHGNGILNNAGNADEDYWPGMNGSSGANDPGLVYDGSVGVTGRAGMINRGGSAWVASGAGTVSGRPASLISSSGLSPYGIRGARTAN